MMISAPASRLTGLSSNDGAEDKKESTKLITMIFEKSKLQATGAIAAPTVQELQFLLLDGGPLSLKFCQLLLLSAHGVAE